MPVRPLDTKFRENSNNLAGQLEEAFNNIGASMMTPTHKRNLNNKTLRTTHGYSRSNDPIKKSLYSRWMAIKTRCGNSNTNCSKYYKEKGISICSEWENSFEAFMNWALSNGYSNNLQIDRIDCSKNYEPNNCRWITSRKNNNNRTNNRKHTYKNFTGTLRELSEEFLVPYTLLRSRITDGWSIERAITTKKLKNA